MRFSHRARWQLMVCAALIGSHMIVGCNTSTTETDPPIKPAPPLKPGVISLAPTNPYADDEAPPRKPATPAAPADLPRGPDLYQVKFETTKGDFVIEVHRDWSPFGADRFHQLVTSQYYDNVKFFRAVPGFMVQFGIHGDPAVSRKWRENHIPDDPVVESNRRGMVTFAKPSIPHARTTQVFINYRNNGQLDGDGFSPFGQVISGMDVVDALNKQYAEEPSKYQQQIQEQGNAFLEQAFPNLDAIKTARVIEAKTPDMPTPETPTPDAEKSSTEKPNTEKTETGTPPADATAPANANS